MIRFTKNNRINYRRSDLWMSVLQGREQQRKVLHTPPIKLPPVSVIVPAQRPTVALAQEHVIYVREDASMNNEHRQLQNLQTELADLPGSLALV